MHHALLHNGTTSRGTNKIRDVRRVLVSTIREPEMILVFLGACSSSRVASKRLIV